MLEFINLLVIQTQTGETVSPEAMYYHNGAYEVFS